mmetsp:Transcript_34383/g.77720  ORF Transcript_34383/g.77720 Transcript_34383/m.77720 type:complete len:182 (+) Transcript_34383:90-635(+)|eukprot:CAMPEP_0197902526 /NCGR_PEP_ID=MMETSP1439-20131203/53679_1 /TAXON_ID=66791 /ORGANISM="Gonyaulax spinifera, Strain CCMP409" /LENGTH=181 /DNA_ID=CAMNT_0043523561 /DNA_START=82 /DNA_END=627 /DNA_ORIENTATION=+
MACWGVLYKACIALDVFFFIVYMGVLNDESYIASWCTIKSQDAPRTADEMWPPPPCPTPAVYKLGMAQTAAVVAAALAGKRRLALVLGLIDISGDLTFHLVYYGGTLAERFEPTVLILIYHVLASLAYITRPDRKSGLVASVGEALGALAVGVPMKLAAMCAFGISANMRGRVPAAARTEL